MSAQFVQARRPDFTSTLATKKRRGRLWRPFQTEIAGKAAADHMHVINLQPAAPPLK